MFEFRRLCRRGARVAFHLRRVTFIAACDAFAAAAAACVRALRGARWARGKNKVEDVGNEKRREEEKERKKEREGCLPRVYIYGVGWLLKNMGDPR